MILPRLTYTIFILSTVLLVDALPGQLPVKGVASFFKVEAKHHIKHHDKHHDGHHDKHKPDPNHKLCEDTPEMQALMKPPTSVKRYVFASSVTNTIDFFAHRNVREEEAELEDCNKDPGRDGSKDAGCHHGNGDGFYDPGNWEQAKTWENGFSTWFSKKQHDGKPYLILTRVKDGKHTWVSCIRKDMELYSMIILASNYQMEHYNCDHDWKACV